MAMLSLLPQDDKRLAAAITQLIITAHDVNRWDLTQAVVDGLCEAAQRYVGELERYKAERGRAP